MSSDTPTEGKCNAQTRDGGYCESYPVNGSDRCRMHGGNGSGAPEGSANALTHGSTADPWNLYENLGEDGAAWVDAKTDAFLEQKGMSREHPLAERVEVAAIMMYQERSGRSHLLKEGLGRTKVVGVSEEGSPITAEEEHYLNRVVSRLNTDIRMTLKDTGHMDSPDDRQADAMTDVSQAYIDSLKSKHE